LTTNDAPGSAWNVAAMLRSGPGCPKREQGEWNPE
jgi:hypothetical protein